METLTISIDNKSAKGKAFLLYLKAIAYEVDSFLSIESETVEMKNEKKLLSQIEAGLKDVRKMREGKAPEKTLRQMLNENQN